MLNVANISCGSKQIYLPGPEERKMKKQDDEKCCQCRYMFLTWYRWRNVTQDSVNWAQSPGLLFYWVLFLLASAAKENLVNAHLEWAPFICLNLVPFITFTSTAYDTVVQTAASLKQTGFSFIQLRDQWAQSPGYCTQCTEFWVKVHKQRSASLVCNPLGFRSIGSEQKQCYMPHWAQQNPAEPEGTILHT